MYVIEWQGHTLLTADQAVALTLLDRIPGLGMHKASVHETPLPHFHDVDGAERHARNCIAAVRAGGHDGYYWN